MKLIILSIILICSFNSCRKSKTITKEDTEFEKVERCRDKWKYGSFKGILKIRLLRLEPKGRYDLTTWPNFFIGIDSLGDTVGVIEYYTDRKCEMGEIINFSPSKKKQPISEELQSFEQDIPVFHVNKKPEDNDLYCAIKIIYYGIIEE